MINVAGPISHDFEELRDRLKRPDKVGDVFPYDPEDFISPDSPNLRVSSHETCAVVLSPFTREHLDTRQRRYHRLLTGCHARLENGGTEKGEETTTFRQLEVLCTETSDPQIAQNQPCWICRLQDELQKLDHYWAPWLVEKLVPVEKVTLEVGVVSRDGERVPKLKRTTQFLELPLSSLVRRFKEEINVAQEWEVYRADYGRLLIEPTGRPPTTDQFEFGRFLIIRGRPDEFLKEFHDVILNGNGEMPEARRAGRLTDLFPGANFVPAWWGTKVPMRSGFTKYARKWNRQWNAYAPVLDSGNIQMLVGRRSNNICSFDWDNLEGYGRWLRRNPWAKMARKLHGKRGQAVFFRLKGDYPDRVVVITRNGGKTDVGEIRLGRGLQMVSGQHPSGQLYRMEDGELPEIEYGDLVWDPAWDKPHDPSEFKSTGLVRRDRCALDVGRLKFPTEHRDYWDFQCPCCAARGKDSKHDNLRIWKVSWGFHCVAGCSREELLAEAGADENDYADETAGENDDES